MSSTNRKRHLWSGLALGLAALIFLGAAVQFQRRHFVKKRQFRPFQEKMYLPDGRKLKAFSLGFQHLYADLLWLRAIQAFGGRWQSGGADMTPIFHYFDVVTDLDPHFIDAYKLGNLVMGDEGHDYPRSLEILRKGMLKNPNSWELPYLGIYNTVWQMSDLRSARWFARMADKTPGRPEFVARMGEFIERKTGRYELAFQMNLQYILRYIDTNNEMEAKLTSIRFWDILGRWNRSKLIEAARRFIKQEGRDPKSMDELVRSRSWEPLTLPTMENLAARIEEYRKQGKPLMPRYEQIYAESFAKIDGAPTDPRGFDYRIQQGAIPKPGSAESSDTLVIDLSLPETLPDNHFNYIVSASDLFDSLVEYVSGINQFIQKYQREHGRWPGSLEELVAGKFNYNDPLGGKFIYNPKTGQFSCTSIEKPPRKHSPIYLF